MHAMFTTTYLVALRAVERVFRPRDERGQASAEYALVLLGAAVLAIFLGGWLMEEGTIPKAFDNILQKILSGTR